MALLAESRQKATMLTINFQVHVLDLDLDW